MLARIDEVQRLVSAEASSREEMLGLLQAQHDMASQQTHELRAVNGQLAAHSGSIRDVLMTVRQSLASVVEIKETLAHIARAVVSFQASSSASMLLRPLDPTRDLPVIMEDALGRQLTIPAEWIERLEWRVSLPTLSGAPEPNETGLLMV
jgi:hypothetical protein